MSLLQTRYVSPDRLWALTRAKALPETDTGCILFTDISGFTSITEKFQDMLNPRQGAETLTTHLNRIYNALISEVECYGGAIITFSGDAIENAGGDTRIYRGGECRSCPFY